MRRRLLRAAVVAALGLVALGFASLEKRIVVRVEGEPVAIRTFAFTVGDALRRAGIPLGERDRVQPPLDRRLADGVVIDVYRAKRVVLLLDGVPRRVVVTGLTVDEILREVNLRGASLADFVGPSRLARVRPGMTIVYRRAVALRVVHDGKEERVITNARTVRATLRELGLELGEHDEVLPSPSAAPRNGMTIRVLRVGIRIEEVEVPVPFSTITRVDPSLEYGTSRVVQEGRAGVRLHRYRSTYVDGRLSSRELLATRLIRKPEPRIIARGRGFPSCACNRGSERGKATWYGANGLTAAHKTLPFGTVVRVTNLATGKSINVVIRDRGPYGPGRIIDLSDDAFKLLAPLGRGIINVEIRW